MPSGVGWEGLCPGYSAWTSSEAGEEARPGLQEAGTQSAGSQGWREEDPRPPGRGGGCGHTLCTPAGLPGHGGGQGLRRAERTPGACGAHGKSPSHLPASRSAKMGGGGANLSKCLLPAQSGPLWKLGFGTDLQRREPEMGPAREQGGPGGPRVWGRPGPTARQGLSWEVEEGRPRAGPAGVQARVPAAGDSALPAPWERRPPACTLTRPGTGSRRVDFSVLTRFSPLPLFQGLPGPKGERGEKVSEAPVQAPGASCGLCGRHRPPRRWARRLATRPICPAGGAAVPGHHLPAREPGLQVCHPE